FSNEILQLLLTSSLSTSHRSTDLLLPAHYETNALAAFGAGSWIPWTYPWCNTFLCITLSIILYSPIFCSRLGDC
ncbi:hypothetical protein CH063_04542, partial [Colletotrichum higginsianum]